MKKWWKERVVYQIYPRSYQDSNGDGVGDLQGIIQHLDLLQELGIGIIWLSPVYDSPDKDNGYDVRDYYDINPKFGTMDDMDRLLAEAEKRDIKIVMDFIMNHTSDQHEWFQKSRDKDSPYRDYYIWSPGKEKGKKPNNWTSFFAEDCWEYDDLSGEYYLHLFAKEQPDLNYHNPEVLQQMKKIMKFWLDKGVAGFRLDVINVIYKQSLEDGKKRLALTGKEHYLTQEGTHEILRNLRQDVFSEYECFTVGETVFVTPEEGYALSDPSRKELDMIFSFEHMEADQYFIKWFPRRFSSKRFAQKLEKWQLALAWNANYLENHDQPRSVSRFGDDSVYWSESAKMLGMLLLTLKGTPFIYQGQEIGMTNFDYEDMSMLQDVESRNVYRFAQKLHLPKALIWKIILKGSRDHARTPLAWNQQAQGGFTSGAPWLALTRNYDKINYESQVKDTNSVWHFYKTLITLRTQHDVLIYGAYRPVHIGKHLYVYERISKHERFMILLNFSATMQSVSKILNGVGITASILTNYGDAFSGKLRPYEGVILKLEPER